jgi:hypothetical protein
MIPIDTYRDAFREMLKRGMTPLEALGEFDEAEFNAAVKAEIESKTLRLNRKTFRLEAPGGLPSLLEFAGRAAREKMNERDMGDAIELWMAGWTSETPYKSQSDVMSWYWRRPPRRKGKPGRFFWSTQQAYNAMKKDAV